MVAVDVMPHFVNFGIQTSEVSPHLYFFKKSNRLECFISIRSVAALLLSHC